MSSTTPLDILKRHRPKGLACEEIAARFVGYIDPISRHAVEHWLSNRRRITLYVFDNLARIFGVPEEEVRLGRMMIRTELEHEDLKPPPPTKPETKAKQKKSRAQTLQRKARAGGRLAAAGA